MMIWKDDAPCAHRRSAVMHFFSGSGWVWVGGRVERRTGVLVEVLLEVLLEQASLGEARGFPRGARHSYSDSPVTSGSE
jgi:hypothetical protein